MNVLEYKKHVTPPVLSQDLKFVRADGLIIDTINLTLNGLKGHVNCYSVRTEHGDIIIPEINIISHQKVDGTEH